MGRSLAERQALATVAFAFKPGAAMGRLVPLGSGGLPDALAPPSRLSGRSRSRQGRPSAARASPAPEVAWPRGRLAPSEASLDGSVDGRRSGRRESPEPGGAWPVHSQRRAGPEDANRSARTAKGRACIALRGARHKLVTGRVLFMTCTRPRSRSPTRGCLFRPSRAHSLNVGGRSPVAGRGFFHGDKELGARRTSGARPAAAGAHVLAAVVPGAFLAADFPAVFPVVFLAAVLVPDLAREAVLAVFFAGFLAAVWAVDLAADLAAD